MKLVLIVGSVCAQYGEYSAYTSYGEYQPGSYDDYDGYYDNSTYYGEYDPNDYNYNPENYDIYYDDGAAGDDAPADENTAAEVANDYVDFNTFDEEEEVIELDYDVEAGFEDPLGERARPRPNVFDGNAAGARYFFTTATTVPTTATTLTPPATTLATTVAPASSWKCWHCDEQSLTDCFANGAEKNCHSGDYGSCMLEVTEENGNMRNICMGCKQAEACETAKAENFWDFLPANVAAARYARPDPYDRFTKCKPEDQYNDGNRSYCRQCCYTDNCFGLAGFTNSANVLEAWTDVIDWDRAEWKLDLA